MEVNFSNFQKKFKITFQIIVPLKKCFRFAYTGSVNDDHMFFTVTNTFMCLRVPNFSFDVTINICTNAIFAFIILNFLQFTHNSDIKFKISIMFDTKIYRPSEIVVNITRCSDFESIKINQFVSLSVMDHFLWVFLLITRLSVKLYLQIF